jgi:streptogramin lyase
VKDPVARKLGADWEGNLWVSLHGAGELLRVQYKTLKMTEFTPPSKDAGIYLAEPDLPRRGGALASVDAGIKKTIPTANRAAS